MKLIPWFLALVLCVLVSGCSNKEKQPPPPPPPVEEEAAPAGPRDHYSLYFKGWPDDDVDQIIGELEATPGFGNWKAKGIMDIYHVYECTFSGELITHKVYDALDETGLRDQSKVEKSGNTLRILRRN